MLADEAKDSGAIQLELHKFAARLGDQFGKLGIRHDAPRSDQGGLGGVGGDTGEEGQGNQISFRVAGGGLRWRVAGR